VTATFKKLIVLLVLAAVSSSLLVAYPFPPTNTHANLTATPLTTAPLTASEIAAAWPNLPSAKELYDAGGCLMVDLRYAGKQSPLVNGLPDGLPDPNSPTLYNVSSLYANCTSDDTILNLGIIVRNDPHIWLEYNSSIYVEVPTSYLQTTVQPYATAVQQVLNAQQTNTNFGFHLGNVQVANASAPSP